MSYFSHKQNYSHKAVDLLLDNVTNCESQISVKLLHRKPN